MLVAMPTAIPTRRSAAGSGSSPQDRGLALGIVVVRDEVDGLAIDVGEQLAGDARQTRLGCSASRRGIAVDGAEVALAVDQR